MEVRRLIAGAPQPPRQEPRARRAARAPGGRHVADVVELEVGIDLKLYDLRRAGRRRQSRRGQRGVVQIHRQSTRAPRAQIAGRIVRIGLGINPSSALQRQRGPVARGAVELVEEALPRQHRALHGRVCGNHPARHREGGLEDREGRDVRARHLVHDAVAVRIGAATETVRRLDPVMPVEQVVGDLTDRYGPAVPEPRAHDQTWSAHRCRHAHARLRQPVDAAHVPSAVAAARERSERNAFRDQRLRLPRLEGIANALEVGGDLAREHLDVAGAEQPGCGARGGNGLEAGGLLQRFCAGLR